MGEKSALNSSIVPWLKGIFDRYFYIDSYFYVGFWSSRKNNYGIGTVFFKSQAQLGVQQNESVIHIHISILFQILFTYRLLTQHCKSTILYSNIKFKNFFKVRPSQNISGWRGWWVQSSKRGLGDSSDDALWCSGQKHPDTKPLVLQLSIFLTMSQSK